MSLSLKLSLSLSLYLYLSWPFLVRSYFLIILIKCLNGQGSQRLLFQSVLLMYLSLSFSLYLSFFLFVDQVMFSHGPPSVFRGFGLVWKAGRL